MRKFATVLVVCVSLLITSKSIAQDLKPQYVQKVQERTIEVTEVMGLDDEQSKVYKKQQTAYFMNVQKTAEQYKPGTDEFRTKVKAFQKESNVWMASYFSKEQRRMWQAHMKEKRAEK